MSFYCVKIATLKIIGFLRNKPIQDPIQKILPSLKRETLRPTLLTQIIDFEPVLKSS